MQHSRLIVDQFESPYQLNHNIRGIEYMVVQGLFVLVIETGAKRRKRATKAFTADKTGATFLVGFACDTGSGKVISSNPVESD